MNFLNLYPNLHYRISKKASANYISKKKLKLISIATTICIIGIIAELIYATLDLVRTKYFNCSLNLLGALIFAFAIFLFTKGKFLTGRLLIVYAATFILAINGSFEGMHAGNQFIFIPIITGTMILFSGKEIKYFYISITPVILVFIFMEATSYSYFRISKSTPHLTYINYLLCFIVSLCSIYLCLYFLNSMHIKWEAKLEKLNTLLTKKNIELKKANRELDSYVYKTTHDLRAPLTSLMGLFELIKNEKELSVIQNYILLGEKSVFKMDSFIGDILLLSRNSKLDLKVEKVYFPEIVDNTFIQLNYLNNSAQISKHISIQNKEFYSDPMRISVLLNNLLANSIRYSDSSKEEQLIKINISISTHCYISIWDNGIGIAEEHLTNVFEMFYRATEKTQGSGLGLYIVKDTVEKLGGTITLNSKEREWTEFIITLPNFNPVT